MYDLHHLGIRGVTEGIRVRMDLGRRHLGPTKNLPLEI